MKDVLFKIFMSIKQNKVSAFNYSKTKSEAVCFNFVEIPETSCTVVTVTVLKNRKKTIALDYVSFAKLMYKLNNMFGSLGEDNANVCQYYFTSLIDGLSKSWYRILRCHRIFLIPTECMFDALKMLTEDNFAHNLEFECGVRELSFYVNTSTHNLKLTRFCKEG